LDDPVAVEVAREVGRPVPNVLIRFLQQLSPNVVVLVKSVTSEHIRENTQLDFDLTPDQMDRLRKREKCERLTNRLDRWGYDVFGEHW
jgi:diketogulonate reductase-like aldo/keto reductase